jgi:hypothetical protein
MKQQGVKRVRGGQLSACYQTKRERVLELKNRLKELEAKLAYAKTQPPCPLGWGVPHIEQCIRSTSSYLKCITRK